MAEGQGNGWDAGLGEVAGSCWIPKKISSESQPELPERSKSNKLLVYKQLCAVVEGTYHLLRRRAGFILGENLEF
jgi:hypothetical protein